MSVIINIILILISLVLIVAVLMQEGNKQGLGAIGGAAETFLGKNKSKSYEGKLLLITKVAAAIFVVIAILATWVNARSYTVKYYVDGEEYFPKYESEISYVNAMLQLGMIDEVSALARLDALEEYDEDTKRASYAKGDEIIAYEPPVREGHTGAWDKELPAVMDKQDYELNAVYTINQYTITVVDGQIETPVIEATVGEATVSEATVTEATVSEATEIEAIEPVALMEPYTATYGESLENIVWPELPEAPEGYTASWSAEFPETVPGYDMEISVVYTPIVTVEDATSGEASPSEASPAEATDDEAVETFAAATSEEASPVEATASESEAA